LSAGPRAAIYSAGFLSYMGFLGFWVKAMTTLALLGTAAILSIAIGIPLGIFCARRQRFYSMIRPIMDFMQTMPAFVFMIPVIAFFGTGKVAAVIITMIFGGTPVVRLTVLGLRGVPETIREAAIAYGASKWYLLRKVDLTFSNTIDISWSKPNSYVELSYGGSCISNWRQRFRSRCIGGFTVCKCRTRHPCWCSHSICRIDLGSGRSG
jgi:hypothetical protein